MKRTPSPPKWALRFFQWFCNDHLGEAVLGDLTDLHERRVRSLGKRRADILFVWNVIQFVQPFAIRKPHPTTHNTMSMYRNFIVIASRTMAKQKMYTAIKIGGFALGIATCIVIALFIRHELSYDKQYTRINDIYRIINDMDGGNDPGKWTAFPAPFAPLLKSNFEEIELIARLIPYNWFNAGSNLVRKENEVENFYEEGFAYADADLLQILEIPMIYGNQKTALSQPNTIVISKSKADKYFPGEDPTGKLIVLNDNKDRTYTIGGVMQDFLPTSHLQRYNFLLTLKGKEFWQGEQDSWCCWNYNPYVRLRAGTDPAEFEAKMLSVKKVYLDYLIKEKNQELEDVRKYHKFKLQPVADVHLRSEGIGDIIPHGDIRFIWMFGGVAVFILLLACINFINLSTAKSANRAKEVGLRKVVGSYRSSLISQFLTESILYSAISFVIGLIILAVGIPFFNQIAGQSIAIPWTSVWFLPIVAGSSILIGVVAGVYPSFYLSAFKPIDVLKGSVARGFKNSRLRGAMVVFQFTTSIVLIIGTYIIYKQMNFILTTKIGFDKDRVMMVQGINTLGDKMQTFKNELLDLAEVENVSLSQYLPVDGTKRDQNQFWREGKSQEEAGIGAQAWWVDQDYLNTMGMKLINGRNFEKDRASDSSVVVVNQAFVKAFNFKDPIGQHIQNWKGWEVVGVVEDFHYENMKGEIRPLVFMRGGWGNIAVVKVKGGDMQQAIASITDVWKRFMPNQAIRYTFVDESYARMYDDVRRAGNIVASFAGLAVIVACLGLFALSAFMIEQRNKEISIRLVLGASLNNIFRLLTDQFVKLVVIAFVIAAPVSYYLMTEWLKGYEYKTDIGWEIFIIAGVISVMIALLTVSFQSVRAALTNPAKNLRAE